MRLHCWRELAVDRGAGGKCGARVELGGVIELQVEEALRTSPRRWVTQGRVPGSGRPGGPGLDWLRSTRWLVLRDRLAEDLDSRLDGEADSMERMVVPVSMHPVRVHRVSTHRRRTWVPPHAPRRSEDSAVCWPDAISRVERPTQRQSRAVDCADPHRDRDR